jgi:hypothetical protein
MINRGFFQDSMATLFQHAYELAFEGEEPCALDEFADPVDFYACLQQVNREEEEEDRAWFSLPFVRPAALFEFVVWAIEVSLLVFIPLFFFILGKLRLLRRPLIAPRLT